MFKTKTILAAVALVVALVAPAAAQSHSSPEIHKQSWSFAGIFGTYDQNQLQRGFQIFRDVCSNCHSARLLAFRNLSEEGGPGFSEEQVKALAAEYEIADASTDTGTRPAVAADRWPSPFATAQDAMDANGGIVPPDFSVLAKARGVKEPGLWWVLNYFTGYSEGGPDYIHALLNGYHEEVPADAHNADGSHFELPEGKHFNEYFPGYAIGMAPPLSDGAVTYEVLEGQTPVPETVEQYSHDIAAFMMWMAEPHLAGRKQTGFVVLLFLVGFAALMYMTKRRIWQGIEH